MQIVIPMSGHGQRFIQAGYVQIKPLIEVDGKPIIEHVIGLFPGEHNFVFICNKLHLEETPLADVLKKNSPQGRIIAIDPHKKGPVFAVSKAFDAIDQADEVIVNYCDFAKYWDYQDFLYQLRERQADGGISAYRGFHPHMLDDTHYAYMRHKDGWLEAIQEKRPFTEDKMSEYASDGTYYFRRGKIMTRYFQKLLEGTGLNGEYYASLPYNAMVADGLKVYIYEIEHMLQWGEPKHLQEYQMWSRFFDRVMDWQPACIPELRDAFAVIPMAGEGKRFKQEGYGHKPLIKVSEKPMAAQACTCLPSELRKVFIYQGQHDPQQTMEKELSGFVPQANFIRIDHMTEGQASTCALGVSAQDLEKPLFIISCDHAMWWDLAQLRSVLAQPDVDCLVFTFKGHPSAVLCPHMYGWAKTGTDGQITHVSVKKAVSNQPAHDHALTGAFYFRKAKFFVDAYQGLVEKNVRVNNEFYVDSCINELIAQGRKAKVFDVEHYIGWGTPNDLRTFEYWQKFFHKCAWHRYQRQDDPWMAHA